MDKEPLIGSGRTADVFARGETCILKLYHPCMPPPAIERELAITCLAHSTCLPVLPAEQIVEVDGRLLINASRKTLVSVYLNHYVHLPGGPRTRSMNGKCHYWRRAFSR